MFRTNLRIDGRQWLQHSADFAPGTQLPPSPTFLRVMVVTARIGTHPLTAYLPAYLPAYV